MAWDLLITPQEGESRRFETVVLERIHSTELIQGSLDFGENHEAFIAYTSGEDESHTQIGALISNWYFDLEFLDNGLAVVGTASQIDCRGGGFNYHPTINRNNPPIERWEMTVVPDQE